MDDRIIIEFSEDELEEILINYYGIEEEDFDINDFSNESIKIALLG